MLAKTSLVLTLLLCAIAMPKASTAQEVIDEFSWDNAIIYFALTDRFANGDTSNDHAYSRGFDKAGVPYPEDRVGHFQGGDFKGLTQKVLDGYFDQLGINAIWISPVVEQVHGWVGGSGGATQEYAYHGYWPLDFTEIDKNWGSKDDLHALIRACHDRGIRVVVDVVINHAGYNTLADMDSLGFGTITDSQWETWRPTDGEDWNSYHSLFIDYTEDTWRDWWGEDFLRAGLPGYSECGTSEQTECVGMLPDFKTESSGKSVALPTLLQRKWPDEKQAQQVQEAEALAERRAIAVSPAVYLVKWVADLVREFGFDGIRLDTAKHIEPATLQLLASETKRARADWLQSNPGAPGGALWMLAEVFGHGFQRSSYFDDGIDAVLNFSFKHYDLQDPETLDSLYADYASVLMENPDIDFVNFLSSHDEGMFDYSNLSAAAALFFSPGNIQIYYGEETNRPGHPRSVMNWDGVDSTRFNLFSTLARFRKAHPAIASGKHERLDSQGAYAFQRSTGMRPDDDRVVIVLGATDRVRLNVSKLFPDDAVLVDELTGKISIVSYGNVQFTPGATGMLLLAESR